MTRKLYLIFALVAPSLCLYSFAQTLGLRF